jgi:hypothetical protein
MTATYLRVIPRDLFNEASLLKCLGRFWIETERYQPRKVQMEFDGEAFDVCQDDDGRLWVRNIEIFIHGKPYWHYRPLNSREPWPLYLTTDDDCIAVFTDDGQLTPELLALINQTPPNP